MLTRRDFNVPVQGSFGHSIIQVDYGLPEATFAFEAPVRPREPDKQARWPERSERLTNPARLRYYGPMLNSSIVKFVVTLEVKCKDKRVNLEFSRQTRPGKIRRD